MASVLTVPSFTGEPRRSSASVSAGGDDARVDWSNLTSGPGGSTVSDLVPIHAGISGNVFLEYAFDVVSSNRFLFILFYFFIKQILTTALTAYNFLMTTPNELILFPISLKFNLVYFQIYLKKFQNKFLCCFEFVC